MDIIKVLAIAGSATLLFLVFELIRRGRLKERYALLWLFSGLVLLILSLSRSLLESLSRLVGIYYPPSLLFLIAFIFLLLITLHFSAVISGPVGEEQASGPGDCAAAAVPGGDAASLIE